jgi:hypothetical protein
MGRDLSGYALLRLFEYAQHSERAGGISGSLACFFTPQKLLTIDGVSLETDSAFHIVPIWIAGSLEGKLQSLRVFLSYIFGYLLRIFTALYTPMI